MDKNADIAATLQSVKGKPRESIMGCLSFSFWFLLVYLSFLCLSCFSAWMLFFDGGIGLAVFNELKEADGSLAFLRDVAIWFGAICAVCSLGVFLLYFNRNRSLMVKLIIGFAGCYPLALIVVATCICFTIVSIKIIYIYLVFLSLIFALVNVVCVVFDAIKNELVWNKKKIRTCLTNLLTVLSVVLAIYAITKPQIC